MTVEAKKEKYSFHFWSNRITHAYEVLGEDLEEAYKKAEAFFLKDAKGQPMYFVDCKFPDGSTKELFDVDKSNEENVLQVDRSNQNPKR